MSHFISNPQPKDHYTYVARMSLELFHEGRLPNVQQIEVEPEYGYMTRFTYNNGATRITYGNDMGMNIGSACDLAKDKDYTKAALSKSDLSVPEGEVFLLNWWADTIRPGQEARGHEVTNTVSKATDYILTTVGFPVYIKPVTGSKGLGVQKIHDTEELTKAIPEYEEARVRALIVEGAVPFPDYRLVMLDGDLISAYERVPLQVTGNGETEISQLIEDLQNKYLEEGRDTVIRVDDPRISAVLGRQGLSLETIPELGKNIRLHDISNLSAGGTSIDHTREVHPRWVDIAKRAAKALNLRLCGVDLACPNIKSGDGDYAILEVNAAPGLDHYASSGEEQQEIVRNLYAKVLNSVPV